MCMIFKIVTPYLPPCENAFRFPAPLPRFWGIFLTCPDIYLKYDYFHLPVSLIYIPLF